MSITRDASRRSIPIHPGEFLREDFMLPLELSAATLAASLGVSTEEIEAVAAEQLNVSAPLAYRLALYFDMSPEYWTKLQTAYELNAIFHNGLDQMKREVQPRVAA